MRTPPGVWDYNFFNSLSMPVGSGRFLVILIGRSEFRDLVSEDEGVIKERVSREDQVLSIIVYWERGAWQSVRTVVWLQNMGVKSPNHSYPELTLTIQLKYSSKETNKFRNLLLRNIFIIIPSFYLSDISNGQIQTLKNKNWWYICKYLRPEPPKTFGWYDSPKSYIIESLIFKM